MSQGKDPDQGEGDLSRRFGGEGRVPDAANVVRVSLERDPEGAAKADREAPRGPQGRRASVDELVAKSHSVVDRIRPAVERAVGRLRSRFTKK